MNLVERFNSLNESLFDFPKTVQDFNKLKKLLSSKLSAGESRRLLSGLYGTDKLFDLIFDIVDSGDKNKDVSKLVIKSLKKSVSKVKTSKEIKDGIERL